MRSLLHRLAAASVAFSLGVAVTPARRAARPPQPPALPAPAVAQHRPLELGGPAPRGDVLDLAVLGHGEVWAVGLASHLWHSRDGGRTWETRPAPTGGWTLNSIHFAGRHGWAAGGGGVLIRTADGGRTWERLRLPARMNSVSVRFLNERVGYVAGGVGYAERATGRRVWGIKILRTVDGGESWRACYADDDSGRPWNIAVPSEEVAVVAVDGGSLLRTGDGGRTWEFVAARRGGFKHVAFDARGVGWAVGERSFQRSTDHGRTWQTPDGLPPGALTRDWWAVDFADSGQGLAVSEDCALLVTYDGGRTWREAETVYHQGKVMRTAGLAEPLRGVRLGAGAGAGLVFGSQGLYPVESFGGPGAAR